MPNYKGPRGGEQRKNASHLPRRGCKKTGSITPSKGGNATVAMVAHSYMGRVQSCGQGPVRPTVTRAGSSHAGTVLEIKKGRVFDPQTALQADVPPAAKKNGQHHPLLQGERCCGYTGTCPRRPTKKRAAPPPFARGKMLPASTNIVL